MLKLVSSAEEAVAAIPDGARIMIGGFGLCGIPENLIAALCSKGTRKLTVISSHAGVDDFGVGLLLAQRQVSKMISTYIGDNRLCEKLVLRGELDVELSPQGTFAERIRAGGAGLGGFYTPTGVGTIIAEGKEVRSWNGKMYVLEQPLRADFALIKAWKGDSQGNLVYRKTGRNFNPIMAAAADTTIAEVEELAEVGQLDADMIHTPGIFVSSVLWGDHYQKRLEIRVTRQ